MGWQALVTRIGIILASLASPLNLFPFLSGRGRRRLIRRVESDLVEHLRSIGIRVELQKVRGAPVRTREDVYAVTLRQLATARVWLTGIHSIEVWRITRKGKDESITLDEITYVVALEPGVTLTRIPILTNAVRAEITEGTAELQWRGFEWGRLPLLVDRLKVDRDLNSRLLEHFSKGQPRDMRITALSEEGKRVGITTTYDPQWLPSREFLACIEEIAGHVRDYVTERNKAREQDAVTQERYGLQPEAGGHCGTS